MKSELVDALWTETTYSHEFPVRIRGPKGSSVNVSADRASDGKSFVAILVKNGSTSFRLQLSKAQASKLVDSLENAIGSLCEHEVGEVHES